MNFRISLTGCWECGTTRHDATRRDATRHDTTRHARVSVPLSSDARREEKGERGGGGKKIRGKRVNEAKKREGGGRGGENDPRLA